MQEIWKSIIDFKGSYEVSNFGNVRSLPREVSYKHGGKNRFWPGKIISIWVPKNGYAHVTLKLNDKGFNFMVHRLVGIHFISAPKDGWQINHKDGNKLNNRLDNLEWVSQSENMRHAFDTGQHSGKGKTHYKSKRVTDGEREFDTTQDAANFHGISKKTAWDMINGRVSNRKNLSYL